MNHKINYLNFAKIILLRNGYDFVENEFAINGNNLYVSNGSVDI